MSTGKIKEYDSRQGFGTIIDSQSGKELTVYANYVSLKLGESLKQEQEVEYDIKYDRHQSWAVNVRVL